MRNDMSSQWNPNLPDLPEAETEEKETIEGENLASVKRIPKVSKWNKVLPEVQASRSSSVSSIKGRGSIAQPGIFQKCLTLNSLHNHQNSLLTFQYVSPHIVSHLTLMLSKQIIEKSYCHQNSLSTLANI